VNGVFGHALIFGFMPVAQRLIGLVLVPLYTRYLSTSDYGEIELLAIATGLFSLVLKLELGAGYLRAWIGAPDDRARAGLFGGSLRLLATLGLVGGSLFLLVSGPLCDLLLGYWIGWGYAVVLAVGIAIDIPALLFHATLQAQLRSRTMVAIGVARSLVGVGVTVLCVIVIETGPVGIFIGGTAGALVAGAAMGWVCIRGLPRHPPDRRLVTDVLRYSLPLLAAAILYFIVRTADRFVLSRYLPLSDLGLYAMAWTAAGVVLTVVVLPVQTSLDVWRHRFFAEPDGAERFAEVARQAMAIIGAAAIAVSTFGADILGLAIDPAFRPAMRIVPLLCVAVMLQGAYSIAAAPFFVTPSTGRWSRVFALGAVAQVIASLALVPVAGIMGAALGVILANLMLTMGALIWGRSLWHIPYAHAPIAVAILAVPALAYARAALGEPGLLMMALGNLGACVGYGIALLLSGMIRPGDWQRGWSVLRRRLRARTTRP
jgi:O-antigen/teichoic acid export membrane protein